MAHRTHLDVDAFAALAQVRAQLAGASAPVRADPSDAKMEWLLLTKPVDLELDAQSFRALWPDAFGPQFYLAKLAPSFFARLLAAGARPTAGKCSLPAARIAGGPFPWNRPALDCWLLESAGCVECRLRLPSEAVDAPAPYRQPREGAGPVEFTADDSACPHCRRVGKHRRLKWGSGFICQSCGRSFAALSVR